MESDRHENEEMVAEGCGAGSKATEREHKGNGSTINRIKIMYTNVDGLVSSAKEVRDYLQDKKPELVCLTETKLTSEIQIRFNAEGYNTWRRDRKNKGGGGVMILTRKDILNRLVYAGGVGGFRQATQTHSSRMLVWFQFLSQPHCIT